MASLKTVDVLAIADGSKEGFGQFPKGVSQRLDQQARTTTRPVRDTRSTLRLGLCL